MKNIILFHLESRFELVATVQVACGQIALILYGGIRARAFGRGTVRRKKKMLVSVRLG